MVILLLSTFHWRPLASTLRQQISMRVRETTLSWLLTQLETPLPLHTLMSPVRILLNKNNYVHMCYVMGCMCHESLGAPLSLDLKLRGDNIREEGADFIILETGSVSFVCSFLADPLPSIQWLRNGQPIVTAQPLRYTLESTFTDLGSIANISQMLTILRVLEQDSGLYSCDVSNQYGRGKTSDISLVVFGEFTIGQQ